MFFCFFFALKNGQTRQEAMQYVKDWLGRQKRGTVDSLLPAPSAEDAGQESNSGLNVRSNTMNKKKV